MKYTHSNKVENWFIGGYFAAEAMVATLAVGILAFSAATAITAAEAADIAAAAARMMIAILRKQVRHVHGAR